MKYKDSYEIWLDVWYRVRLFNLMTGNKVPDLYKPKQSTDKESLLGLRNELDDIVDKYGLNFKDLDRRFYLTTRERIEALADIV